MIVLHAVWDSLKSNLHLWAESSLLVAQPTQRERSSHPFALNHRSLSLLHVTQSRVVPTPSHFTLLLPSTSEIPLPSPQLPVDHEIPSSVILSPWDVPTLMFCPYDALLVLLSLHPSTGCVFGSSLQLFLEAAKYSLELITTQSYVPALRQTEMAFQAVWEAVPDDERVRALSQALPPVCTTHAAQDVVVHFLNETVDAFVRKTLSSERVFPPPSRSAVSLSEQWLYALSSDNPALLASEEFKAFSRTLVSFFDQLKPDPSPFRVCFKLDPPDNGGMWELTYYLQAKDDPSLLIPADEVWKSASEGVTFLKRRCKNPQERLLTELGKASRLYPPVEESLKAARPVCLSLTTEEAYHFLRHSAPLLDESGFGVLLPAWWQSPAVRPRVKVRVRTKGAGFFGVNSIMAYDWKIALGEETLSQEEFDQLVSLKTPLIQTRGQWVELRPEEVEKAISFFQNCRGEMTLGDALKLELGQEKGVGLPVVLEGDEGVQPFLKDLTSSTFSLVEPPPTFCGVLRPYQVRGVSWLAFLMQFGFGACLADDMGLGKTIEIIAFLLRTCNHTGPTLVVCPMSVVGNWQKELERFAPSLKVLVHHGAERLSSSFEEEARKYHVVITSYALVHRDEAYLSAVEWERIVIDEAQNIKNPDTKQAQALKRMKAREKIALTGTPVENRLSELWSIMDFLNKGYLGSQKEFNTHFVTPIEKYHDNTRANVLKRMILPFVLRRLKTDKTIIQDLPEKIEMKVFCNLTREQATLYKAVVQEMLEKIENAEGIQRKGLVLSTLTQVKQICDHPALFLKDMSKLPGRSGKLARMEEMLEEALSEGDKALIFTQFAEMGGMLQHFLQERMGCETLFLYGGTAKKKRDDMIERFQSEKGPPLFVLSLKAGGFGLNLTAANHVFHFDRWWNPAVENQATDRAFRIGQKRNVQVHKFVTIGTLEERIDALIEEKKGLADRIVGAGEEWITEMSTEKLRELFAMGRDIQEYADDEGESSEVRS